MLKEIWINNKNCTFRCKGNCSTLFFKEIKGKLYCNSLLIEKIKKRRF